MRISDASRHTTYTQFQYCVIKAKSTTYLIWIKLFSLAKVEHWKRFMTDWKVFTAVVVVVVVVGLLDLSPKFEYWVSLTLRGVRVRNRLAFGICIEKSKWTYELCVVVVVTSSAQRALTPTNSPHTSAQVNAWIGYIAFHSSVHF